MKFLGRKYERVEDKVAEDKKIESEPEVKAPDIVGRITAARVWYTRPGPTGTRTLMSTRDQPGYEWPNHHVLKAECLTYRMYSFDPFYTSTRHRSPDPTCQCGVWATAQPHVLGRFKKRGSAPVYGVVELWGRVLTGPDGWRGEYARVAGVVMRNPRHVRRAESQAATTYGVPLLKDWPELTPPSLPDDLQLPLPTGFASVEALNEYLDNIAQGGRP